MAPASTILTMALLTMAPVSTTFPVRPKSEMLSPDTLPCPLRRYLGANWSKMRERAVNWVSGAGESAHGRWRVVYISLQSSSHLQSLETALTTSMVSRIMVMTIPSSSTYEPPHGTLWPGDELAGAGGATPLNVRFQRTPLDHTMPAEATTNWGKTRRAQYCRGP